MLADVDPTHNAVKLLHVFAVTIYFDNNEKACAGLVYFGYYYAS